MFGSTIGAIFRVIIAMCKGAERYAEAFEATGSVANRVVRVADKHVANWEYEQDAKILETRAQVAAKLLEAKSIKQPEVTPVA